jgi:hypothetical protein
MESSQMIYRVVFIAFFLSICIPELVFAAPDCTLISEYMLRANRDISRPENLKAPGGIVDLLRELEDPLSQGSRYCGFDSIQFGQLLFRATSMLWSKQQHTVISPSTAQANADRVLSGLWVKAYLTGKLGMKKNLKAAKCWSNSYVTNGRKCLEFDPELRAQIHKAEKLQ